MSTTNGKSISRRLSLVASTEASLVSATGASHYRVECEILIAGLLKRDLLAALLRQVISRHEILHTAFQGLEGMEIPLQVLNEHSEIFSHQEVDLTAFNEDMQQAFVEQKVRELHNVPFDYERGTVMRTCLFQRAADKHSLFISMSALCADVWTINNLVRVIAETYEAALNGASILGEVVQYADYSEWQNELLEREDQSDARAFWAEHNKSQSPDLVLPLERSIDELNSEPRSLKVKIDRELRASIELLAADHETTAQTVMLACWQVELGRLAEQQDISVATAFDGRRFEYLQDALGPLGKFLPIPCHLEATSRYRDVLKATHSSLQLAHARQDWFSEDFTELWAPTIGFAYVEQPRTQRVADLSFVVDRLYSCNEQFKLKLSCIDNLDECALEFYYASDRFDHDMIVRLAGQFLTLLSGAVRNPDQSIFELPLLSARELEQLVLEWNETEREYEREACLHELFALQAARTPEAIAVSYEAEQLSYRELNERANQVGHYLQGLGVGPEVLVGLCLERSLELVVGLLGILKAGGAYVPVDPQYPVERQGWMLGDAGVNLVLTQSRLVEQLRAQAVRMVALDGEWEAISKESKENPSSAAVSRNVAYVIYTSGSSGQPKGVLVEHRSVINLWTALERGVYEQAGQVKCVSMNAPLGFDASVKQVVQLLNGRRLCVVPETVRQEPAALLRYVRAQGIEVLDTTPSQLRQLLGEAAAGVGSLPAVVLVGGEAVERELWQQLGEQAGTVYYNLYGPTECTVDASVSLVRPGLPVIGRPLANVRLYLLDERGEPVPVGVRGELYIGGAGVARGYWGRAALTAERFVADRWSGKSGERLYRSGDLGRYLPGGEVEFLGRADGQVKIRGHRVEVGEVEAALREYEGVKDCVVVAGAEASGERRLIAYVIGAGGQAAMARELPEAGLYELPNGLAISQQNKNETEYLYDEIFQKQTYLRHGMKLRRGACVFDVGANIGLFSLFVCGQAPGARVYCFEPIKQIYESLRVNSALYGEQVAVFDYGLSNREREAAFTYYPHYTMMSGLSAYADAAAEVRVIESYLENEARGGSEAAARLWAEREELLAGRFEQRTEHCRLRALSDVMQEQGVGQIDLLKVDVQRAELEVLEGIRGEDWQKIKQVVMEVHDGVGEASEGRVEQIRALLEEQGFVVVSEQDELLVGTDRHNLYGWREAYRRELVDEDSAEESGKEKRLGVSELREYLQQRLPGYMVPTAWVLLNELPLTRHGKVDHRRLPEPGAVAAEQEREVVPAQTPVQELLVGIWQQLLGVARVGVDDNFFELGGHSLLATQLMSRVREVCGMEVGLRRLFEAPTVRGLAECVEQELGAAVGLKGPALERVSRVESLPLSFAQQRLWFLDQLEPGSAFYNSPAAVRLVGQLDVAALELTLSEIVRRHEVLRTSFANVGGEPRQVVAAAERLELPVVDLRGCGTVAEREALAASLMQEEAQRPFDLSVGPLLRVKLLQLGETEQVVLLTMHHIVSDGWSMGVLIGEVAALYEAYREGRESPLPELAIQYGDFAVWQREWLQGEVLEQQLSYWRQQLAALPVLELPTDRARPAVQSYRGAHHSFRLAPELAAGLKELSQQEGVTLYMTLLAAFQVLLSRYSGQEDIVVGTDIANRNRAEIEPLIGFFINQLVLRTDLSGGPSFAELLGRVREVCLGAYAHQDVPFEKLVEELQPERDLSRGPLFQVKLILQNAPSGELRLEGLQLSRVRGRSETAKFDLTVALTEAGGVLSGTVEYNTDLFGETTMARLVGHYEQLLESIVKDRQVAVSELRMLSAGELEQLVVEWNETARNYEQEACLHELFAAQAARTPEAIAVSYEAEQLSYRELNERANQVGHYLQGLGVGPEVLVGLCMERSLEMVVGILGILKAGGAYLPVDPQYPVERQAWMLGDAGVNLVLTQSRLVEQLPAQGIQTVALDGEWEVIGGESKADPNSGTVGRNLAYVIYTSGSSGQPKGVAIEHQGVCNLAAAQGEGFAVGSGSRVLQFASLSFDAAVSEIFVTLGSGGTLCVARAGELLVGEVLQRVLSEQQINVVTLPPTVLRGLEGEGELRRLQTVVVAGEQSESGTLQRWLSGGRRVLNAYGPTESSVCATMWAAGGEELERGKPRLGRALSNVQVYVLDRELRVVPVGVRGEIYIGGAGVGRGYLQRAELTAGVFVPDSFSGVAGARLYRSGDLGRYLESGELEYLGRADQQVKVRGYRIELEEIEATLKKHEGVADCAVVSQGDGSGEQRLVCYVVSSNESRLSVSELRDYLKARLPEYMVPSAFVMSDELPLTESGKLDRKALPALHGSRPELQAIYTPPRTSIEEVLAGIWSQVLGVEKIGVFDNFFELGGDSIRSVQILARAHERGLTFTLQDLFQHKTIDELARIQPSLDAPSLALTTSKAFCLISMEDRALLPIDVEDAYPLTMLQAGMIFHSEFRADLYHSIISFRLRTAVDLDALRAALGELSSSHPSLRTSFDLSRYSEPLQLVHKDGGAQMDYEDLRQLESAAQDQVIKDWLNAEKSRPFDWTRGSLMRFRIHQLAEEMCQFSFSAPHALMDGWSDGLLLTQLFNRYFALLNQTGEPLDPVPTALFRDYVALERQALNSEEVQEFWANQLSGSTFASLALATPAETTGTEPAHHMEVLVSGEELEGLKRLARLAAVPLKSVLLAAHSKIISVISGQQDVVTGLLSNGREEKIDGDRVIGLFLNTLPICMKVSGGTWLELVQETFQSEWKMLPYRRYPLMQMQRNNGGRPLFETIFNYTHFHIYDSIQNQEQVNVLGSAGVSETNFTIIANFSLNLDQSSLRLRLSSDLGKLSRHQAESIGSFYRETLTNMAQAPFARYEQQTVMPEADMRRCIVEWNGTETDYQSDTFLVQLFEQQVWLSPDRPAVSEENERLTYKELNQRANQLARYLKKLGIGPERVVAVCMERGVDMLIAMLAIFKAGGVYVPLDPTYPVERLVYMLDDTATMALLTHTHWLDLFRERERVVCVDSERDVILQEDNTNLGIAATGQQLAYIIYTSGSTGLPKGAMITHGGMLNHLWTKVHALKIATTDIVAQTASQSFDISVWQFLAALLAGAEVRIIDDQVAHDPGKLLTEIGKSEISILETVPSLLRVMLEAIKTGEATSFEMPSLRWLIVTGEALPPGLAQQWTTLYPHVPMMNAYGPTECSDDVTHYVIDHTTTTSVTRIPIGKPVANTQLYILDQHLVPAPIGVAGELCAGGAGVGRGYLNNPAKTAERFIPDPFSNNTGARLYRTGDLARHLPDGNLDFLNRIDRQVKIRGYRIEVSEIESVLADHADVSECVVLAREAESGELGLVAYVITAPGHEIPTVAKLRAYLKEKLPPYMVPSGWSFLDKLPLTSDGKLNVSGLSAPEFFRLESAHEPPRTPVEELLCGMWQELLSVPVGIRDNFFESGGHSLLATQLLMRVRTVFGVALPLRTVFEKPTVAELSEWIEEALRLGQGLDSPPIVKVARNGGLPLSFAQQRLWFLDRLRPGESLYNIPIAIELQGLLDREALQRALNEIVRRHEVLRTRFTSEAGVAQQIVAAEMELELEIIDLREFGVEEQEQEKGRLAKEEAQRPFDLSVGPLLRVKLVQLGETEQVVLLTIHHIVSDGWSMGVLIGEVAALYEAYREGRESPLAELAIQYGDFAVWQREWLQGEVLEQQLSYWRQQLAEMPALELPVDRARPAVQSYRGAQQAFAFPNEVSETLKELSHREGVTMFMTLLAAFAVTLRHYSGQEEILIGTNSASRNRAEIEPLIGFFINQLVLRCDVSRNPTFKELMSRAREVTLEAYAHQDLPFEKLVEGMQLERDLSRSPLFQVKFELNEAFTAPLQMPALSVKQFGDPSQTVRYDLHLTVNAQDLSGKLAYATDLFEPATISWMTEQLKSVLSAVAKQPDVRVEQLEQMLREADRQRDQDKAEELKRARLRKYEQVKRKVVVIPSDSEPHLHQQESFLDSIA